MPAEPSQQSAVRETCDVLVLGGGLAGSTAAALLAQRGRFDLGNQWDEAYGLAYLRSFEGLYYTTSLLDLRHCTAAWRRCRQVNQDCTVAGTGRAQA
jgi:glycine/D-amino acid oxidase-like deaminating enzyme